MAEPQWVADMQRAYDEQSQRIADLERRLAEAQRDGERLDKLEALKKPGQRWMIHDWTFHKDITAYVGVWHGENHPGKSHDTLRSAIDAAMSARKEGV